MAPYLHSEVQLDKIRIDERGGIDLRFTLPLNVNKIPARILELQRF